MDIKEVLKKRISLHVEEATESEKLAKECFDVGSDGTAEVYMNEVRNSARLYGELLVVADGLGIAAEIYEHFEEARALAKSEIRSNR